MIRGRDLRSADIAQEFHVGGGNTGFEFLVLDAQKSLFSVYRQAQVDLDDAGGDLTCVKGAGDIGFFESPGKSLQLAIGTGRASVCPSDERDSIGAIQELLPRGVDHQVVEQVGIAVAFELDEAVGGSLGYRHMLRIYGDKLGWRRGEILYPAVLVGADAKAFVVGQRLAGSGIFIPVVEKPGLIGDDRVVEADENGLHVDRDIGLQRLEDKSLPGKDGIDKTKGRMENGIGGYRIGDGSIPRRNGDGRRMRPKSENRTAGYDQEVFHVLSRVSLEIFSK